MLESKVERYLCDRVKALGGHAYKFVSPARRNVPDRLVVLPGGRQLFVECKAPGISPSPAQQREHERLRALGQTVFVVDSFESADLALSI